MLEIMDIFLSVWVMGVLFKFLFQGRKSLDYEYEEQKVYQEFVKPMRMPYCALSAVKEIRTVMGNENAVLMTIVVISALIIIKWARELELKIYLLKLEEKEEAT